jgi:tetratricopeptide (TPR) repeat protein
VTDRGAWTPGWRSAFAGGAVLLVAALSGGCAARAPRVTPPSQIRSSVPTLEANDKALSQALLMAVVNPGSASERRIAEEYRAIGILDAASDHLTRALRFDPTDAEAYEGLARIWRDWGFPQMGLPDASRAVYFAPESASAYNTLGTILAALQQRSAARQAYDRAHVIDGDAAYVLNNLCALSLDERDPRRAIAECDAALALDPTMHAAQVNRAKAVATP